MRQLAAQLIERNRASFDPSRFEDRYEQALMALVQAKAKAGGKKGEPPPMTTPRRIERRQPHGGLEALLRDEKAIALFPAGKDAVEPRSVAKASAPKAIPTKAGGKAKASAAAEPVKAKAGRAAAQRAPPQEGELIGSTAPRRRERRRGRPIDAVGEAVQPLRLHAGT